MRYCKKFYLKGNQNYHKSKTKVPKKCPLVCLFVCVGPGYCIQCGSSNPLGFIGFSLKPKVLGVCNAPSTNGSYGYIGIGGGNLLTLPTPVVKPNTTPAVI